jgi:hypothetical protein
MPLDEHDKDIHSDGACVRLYHWHGGGDGPSAHRLGDQRLPHRKLLSRQEVAVKERSPSFPEELAVRAERLDGNREAMKALALSVAGVMTITVVWNLMMLFLY